MLKPGSLHSCCHKKPVALNTTIIQALKSSLFCPFKGTVITSIALLHLLYGIGYFPFNKATSNQKVKEGAATIIRHLPQLAEMLGAAIFCSYMAPNNLKSVISCLLICWVGMLFTCMTLRYYNFVKSCCEDFDIPNTFNKNHSYNSLCLKNDYFLNTSISPPPSNIISRAIEHLIYTGPFQLLLVLQLLENSSKVILEKLLPDNSDNLNSLPSSLIKFYTHMASGGILCTSVSESR